MHSRPPTHPPPTHPGFFQLLKELYEQDIVSEEALLCWADEKGQASEEEKVFLHKVGPVLVGGEEGGRARGEGFADAL
jgi:hypothetical protein